MNFPIIVWKSLRQHWLSSSLAVVSIAAGVALLLGVVSLREQTHEHFDAMGSGVDLVLGPKGSQLQITLNAVYNLETMPGRVPYPLCAALEQRREVAAVFPFCSGHSYRGLRVNAIEPRFFTAFRLGPQRDQKLKFAGGRSFAAGSEEAVLGWEAARVLKIGLGDGFCPVCGINPTDKVHHDDHFRFVGILEPTGLPLDRAIYIPLERFFTLAGHGDVAKMALDPADREVSGALVQLQRIRGGAVHPGVIDLKYKLDQNPRAQLVDPAVVMPQLMDIIGWVDSVLLAIAGMVTALSSLFLFVSLLTALNERRRSLALMRSLGATRRTVCGLICVESLVITLCGGVLGLLLGHALVAVGAGVIKAETGIAMNWNHWSLVDHYALPGLLFLALVVSLVPARQAYRLGVLENLAPTS
jgi:putative ABC transport system permease protein